MGGNQSQFIHHKTNMPWGTTYIYTRSNKFGAVESRRTFLSKYGVTSTISFSDGHGYIDFVKKTGSDANNLDDYSSGGPKDGFNEGDYSYLYDQGVVAPQQLNPKDLGCRCGPGCLCSQ